MQVMIQNLIQFLQILSKDSSQLIQEYSEEIQFLTNLQDKNPREVLMNICQIFDNLHIVKNKKKFIGYFKQNQQDLTLLSFPQKMYFFQQVFYQQAPVQPVFVNLRQNLLSYIVSELQRFQKITNLNQEKINFGYILKQFNKSAKLLGQSKYTFKNGADFLLFLEEKVTKSWVLQCDFFKQLKQFFLCGRQQDLEYFQIFIPFALFLKQLFSFCSSLREFENVIQFIDCNFENKIEFRSLILYQFNKERKDYQHFCDIIKRLIYQNRKAIPRNFDRTTDDIKEDLKGQKPISNQLQVNFQQKQIILPLQNKNTFLTALNYKKIKNANEKINMTEVNQKKLKKMFNQEVLFKSTSKDSDYFQICYCHSYQFLYNDGANLQICDNKQKIAFQLTKSFNLGKFRDQQYFYLLLPINPVYFDDFLKQFIGAESNQQIIRYLEKYQITQKLSPTGKKIGKSFLYKVQGCFFVFNFRLSDQWVQLIKDIFKFVKKVNYLLKDAEKEVYIKKNGLLVKLDQDLIWNFIQKSWREIGNKSNFCLEYINAKISLQQPQDENCFQLSKFEFDLNIWQCSQYDFLQDFLRKKQIPTNNYKAGVFSFKFGHYNLDIKKFQKSCFFDYQKVFIEEYIEKFKKTRFLTVCGKSKNIKEIVFERPFCLFGDFDSDTLFLMFTFFAQFQLNETFDKNQIKAYIEIHSDQFILLAEKSCFAQAKKLVFDYFNNFGLKNNRKKQFQIFRDKMVGTPLKKQKKIVKNFTNNILLQKQVSPFVFFSLDYIQEHFIRNFYAFIYCQKEQYLISMKDYAVLAQDCYFVKKQGQELQQLSPMQYSFSQINFREQFNYLIFTRKYNPNFQKAIQLISQNKFNVIDFGNFGLLDN